MTDPLNWTTNFGILSPSWKEALRPRKGETQEQWVVRNAYADKAEINANQFAEAGSGVYAIRAFLMAREAGVPVPEVVLSWLGSAFYQYLSQDGGANLEQLLGLTKGRGQAPEVKDYRRSMFVDEIMREIWQNTKMFMISPEQSAELVAARLDEQHGPMQKVIDKIALGPNAPTSKPPRIEGRYECDTLVRYWYGEQGKHWRNMRHHTTPGWTDEEKRIRAASYPSHASQLILSEFK